MSNKYDVGDIVILKNSPPNSLHMIIDINNYDGIEYEVAEIYPIKRYADYDYINEVSCLELHSKYGSLHFYETMTFIQHEREKKGIYDEPEYLQFVRFYYDTKEEDNDNEERIEDISSATLFDINKKINEESINELMDEIMESLEENLDLSRTDLLETVDNCLD